MKRLWLCSRRVGALTVLGMFVVSFSFSQSPYLAGQILDETTHGPVENASMLLLETGQQRNTDANGRFIFEKLKPGLYTLSMHHITYANVERIVVIGEGHNDSVIIMVQPSIRQFGEVVVRSTRTYSPNGMSPYPVDVSMSDRLLQQSAVTVPDVLAQVPGLSLVRDGAWPTTLSLRGMSRSNIIVLVDNTRIESATDIAGTFSLINTQDLDRVETMKSPGSVLYGSGALGGVVQLLTKHPAFSDDFQTSVELTSGLTSVNDGLSEHIAFVSSSDRYAIRLSGRYRKAGNTMTPAGTLPNSQFHDFSFSNSLGLKTIGGQRLLLSYQRSQAEDAGIPGGAPIAALAKARYSSAWRELMSTEYTIPNILPTIPLLTVRMSRQTIVRNVEILQNPSLILTPHASNVTSTIQIESKVIFPDNHLFTVGADVWRRALDSRRERYDKLSNQITGERPAPLSTYFSGGMYAQDEWKISQKNMVMVLGARYDWVRVSNDEALHPEYIIKDGMRQDAPTNQKILWNPMLTYDHSWSANAGVQYSPSELIGVTVLAATAFRAPSLEERYQFIDLGNIVRVGDPGLAPERSMCLNSGVHAHTERLNIQADFFFNHLTDLITEVPGSYEGRNAYFKKNIGEARLFGFEISAEQSLTTWAVLRSSAAYVRGEDLLNHTDLPQIAPLSFRIEAEGRLHSLGTLRISCAGSASQNNLAAGELRTPGYATFDAGIVSEPWNIGYCSIILRAGIENIFDRSYRIHLSTLRGIIQQEPGRNYSLSIAIHI